MDEEGNLPPPPPGYRNFRDSPMWARLLAISGGPIANYLAAMLLVIGAFAAVGVKEPIGVEVADFGVGSPAAAAGLEIGDEITGIDGHPVRGADAREQVMELTKAKLGETVQITVERGDETIVYPVALNSEAPALNTSLGVKGEFIAISPAKAVVLGIEWPFQQTARQLSGLWSMITGKNDASVGGPVAIAKAIKGSAERGVVDLILFSALISTVLGMTNLLPLPALDGGRLIFLLYELVTRRPPNKMLEERIHMIGMLGLLGLLAWATFNDLRPEKPNVWEDQAAPSSRPRRSSSRPSLPRPRRPTAPRPRTAHPAPDSAPAPAPAPAPEPAAPDADGAARHGQTAAPADAARTTRRSG